MVIGDNNILLGSYDTIIGSNNFVFVSKYAGQADGDLIIQNWKVQLDKRHLTSLYPNEVVSTLTDLDTNMYGRFLKQPMTSVLSLVSEIVNVVDTITQTTMTVNNLPAEAAHSLNTNTNTNSGIDPNTFQSSTLLRTPNPELSPTIIPNQIPINTLSQNLRSQVLPQIPQITILQSLLVDSVTLSF